MPAEARRRLRPPPGNKVRFIDKPNGEVDVAKTALSARGANVKAVQRTLGHKSAAMTLDVYSGLFDDDLDGVADRLDADAHVYSLCTDADVVKLPETGASG